MTMNTGKFGAAIAMAIGLSGLASNYANAAALTFDDTASNETITVSACDFEGGISVNGTPMGSCGVGSGGTTTVDETATPVSFTGSWIDLGQTPTGSRTIYLVEAATPTLISDIFQYNFSSDGSFGTISGTFQSDVNGNLGALPVGVAPGDVFVENGTTPVAFSLPFLGGQLISAADVPEPGSIALVGLGLAGLAASRRRKA